MPQALTLDLSDDDRRQLENARDHHGKPYVRERATALLKIADGQSGRKVTLEGLLKKRKSDTVYDWFHRYKEKGVERHQIDQCLEKTRQEPERYVFLYQDECGYYRNPSLAEGVRGARREPPAPGSPRTRFREAAPHCRLSERPHRTGALSARRGVLHRPASGLLPATPGGLPRSGDDLLGPRQLAGAFSRGRDWESPEATVAVALQRAAELAGAADRADRR